MNVNAPANPQRLTQRLNILVVDDEALARQRLATLLDDCLQPCARMAAQAAEAQQALALLAHSSAVGAAFDAVLLDIHMPGMDGMALARCIAQMPPESRPAIIFVTAYAGHAVQAFEVEAVDYLTKPVRLERLQQALQKAERLVQANRGFQLEKSIEKALETPIETLLIHDRGRAERVALSSVLYFKAELKYLTVRTTSRNYILDASLNDLEARHGEAFLRIHRNALVAKSAVRNLEKQSYAADGADPADGAEVWAVRLAGVAETLAVSRRHLAAVREAIAVQTR